MAGLFDFEHYYKEKTIKTDIKLDVSDIPLKTTPSSLATNDDGSIDDVNMNELVTNNVMYLITGIYKSDGSAVSVEDRVVLDVTTTDLADGGQVAKSYYIAIGYPLDDLAESGIFEIPESRSIILDISLTVGMVVNDVALTNMRLCDVDDSDVEGTTVTALTVSVTPRFRLMNPSLPQYDINPFDANYTNVDQNFWHQTNYIWTSRALAAVGLRGNLYQGFKWYNKQTKGKSNAVYRYDSFVKAVNVLGEHARENNLGIKTVFYDSSYADPIGDTEGLSDWQIAVKTYYADWTRTKIKNNAKMIDVYTSDVDKQKLTTASSFYFKCMDRNPSPLPNIRADGATAVIPTVSDVFKKLYTPKEELADEFTERYFDTYNEIMSIRGVRRFMSSGLKRKLSQERYKLKKYATEKVFALDLASCTNFLKAMYEYGIPQLSYGISDIGDDNGNMNVWTKGIRLFSTKGFETLYALGTVAKESDGKVATKNSTPPYYLGVSYRIFTGYDETQLKSNFPKEWWSGFLHGMMGNATYSDWQMAYQPMKVSDIKKQLADIYAGMYNDYYGFDNGDPGFLQCYYIPDQKICQCTVLGTDGQPFDFNVNAGLSTDTDPPESELTPYMWTPDIMDYLITNDNHQCTYLGSVSQFIDICITMIRGLYNRIGNDVNNVSYDNQPYYFNIGSSDHIDNMCQYVTTGSYSDDDELPVVCWDTSSTATDLLDEHKFEPSYETIDDIGEATTYTVNDCVKFALNTMDDAIDEIDNILTVQGLHFGLTFLLLQKLRLRDAKRAYEKLKDTIDRIKWYQIYTNESVFTNKTFIGTRPSYGFADTPYNFMPARFLLPVQMYKRVKVRYKRWGRTRHKMVKRSIGVRWCEITFVDNDVYEAYPPNSSEPMQYYPIGKDANVSTSSSSTVCTFDYPIEGDSANLIGVGKVTQFTNGTLLLISDDGLEVDVTINNASKFTANTVIDGIGRSVYVVGIYVPLENTEKSDERTKIRLEYNMPYIPYDSEIRRWAFMNYGAFDQDKYASDTREMPSDPDTKVPGWVIFKNSSKRIGDMRASMGIYDAVAILMGILRNTYGASMVELVETMRSKDDQELMSSGGGESTFLSWHNYGLAVKILISGKATGMPIEDGSPEFMQLIDIADGFTTACLNGVFGKPLNVVWCGRLKIGANIFVWEFLPIGVNHKDAMKFREATLNQEDPVASLGYVNVDANKLVYNTRPQGKLPYVLRNSAAYKNALLINGQHYVSPRNIRNYTVPHDIVLRNVLEFCNLIRTKMQANGSSLNNRDNIYEWKALNDKSYKQLLIYYGLTGSLTAARALVSGEYVETYKDIVDRKYTEDMVEMVKDYLGNLYQDAKIFVEESADGGAWLSLSDGKLHLKTTDIRPTFDQNSKDDFYGEKLAPVECTERGLYIDGVFRTEDELVQMGYPIETVSEHSFIDGFNNGKVIGDDALLLHTLVATQIKEEFDALKDLFENYGGGIMYDHFVDGPNASMADMVENEFGLIAGQDLIGFDELRAIFRQKSIEDNAGKFSDGSTQGAGGVGSSGSMSGDIFEKVVSNAELAGVRKASLTKEHITVTVQPSNMSTEELYKVIMKGAMTQANDMFKK